MAVLLAAIIVNSLNATSANATFLSKTLMGTGVCDGRDQVAISEQPWEASPISILGVTIALQVDAQPSTHDYAFAGNSFVPDLMALEIGSGVQTIMYPAGHGFTFPPAGSPAPPHVDAHVNCRPPRPPPRESFLWQFYHRLLGKPRPPPPPAPTHYQVWLTIFYDRP